MKKRKSKNIYDSAISMDNIENIWNIIKKTCKNRREVYFFYLNLNTNLYYIWKVLKNRSYKPDKYRTFLIFEPKPRLVMSQTITDKIINHFVANYYLIPTLESTLIDSNVATRKNKGSKYAMNLIKKYFNKILINNPNKEIYCLKIDISKYFYSIDHNILLNMLRKRIKDKDVINLINIIIKETNSNYINDYISICREEYNIDIPYYLNNKGLSIGAMSSQFLAIYFLNDLDHLIKEKLNCKYYVRYMDDLLILDINKDKLKKVYNIIEKEVIKLKLKINKKSNFYRSSIGFNFLGYTYKIINNKLYISCNKNNVIRINQKLKILQKYDNIKYIKSLASYNGYFAQAYRLERRKYSMSAKEIVSSYKKKYEKYLIIIKEGIFFKTYDSDSIIMWYLFEYKFFNKSVSFGNNSYDKVITKLKQINISFIIVDKEKELLSYHGEDIVYDSYFNLSNNAYIKYEKENSILNNIKNIISNHPESCQEIEEYLNKLSDKYNSNK